MLLPSAFMQPIVLLTISNSRQTHIGGDDISDILLSNSLVFYTAKPAFKKLSSETNQKPAPLSSGQVKCGLFNAQRKTVRPLQFVPIIPSRHILKHVSLKRTVQRLGCNEGLNPGSQIHLLQEEAQLTYKLCGHWAKALLTTACAWLSRNNVGSKSS